MCRAILIKNPRSTGVEQRTPCTVTRPHARMATAIRQPSGDPMTAPRCGAQTRQRTACQSPAIPNGRCRMHGGASTGPRTAAGLARIRAARTQPGRFSAVARAFERWRRQYVANGYRSARAMTEARARAHFLLRAAEELPASLVTAMRGHAFEEVARDDAARLVTVNAGRPHRGRAPSSIKGR